MREMEIKIIIPRKCPFGRGGQEATSNCAGVSPQAEPMAAQVCEECDVHLRSAGIELRMKPKGLGERGL